MKLPKRREAPPAGAERDTVFARLRRAGLAAKKGFGQHFLHDRKILAEIADAAGLDRSDTVLEVGTGPATLTREIAARAGRVLTVEIDRAMAEFARRELSGLDGVRLLRLDALDGKGGLNPSLVEELRRLGPFKAVANLPYGIATPFILSLFSSGLDARLAVFTVQRELAVRLRAAPGGRDYGPASVVLAFWATLEKVRTLPPGAFWPPPAVVSEVVRIRPRARPLGDPSLFPAYCSWAHRLFSQRRKQLGGLLREALEPAAVEPALKALDKEPRARPEEISPEGFLILAREFGF
jgi:16S rRNA (adenine1518-N6/adenine1519-N6)-dimethyltransferase